MLWHFLPGILGTWERFTHIKMQIGHLNLGTSLESSCTGTNFCQRNFTKRHTYFFLTSGTFFFFFWGGDAPQRKTIHGLTGRYDRNLFQMNQGCQRWQRAESEFDIQAYSPCNLWPILKGPKIFSILDTLWRHLHVGLFLTILIVMSKSFITWAVKEYLLKVFPNIFCQEWEMLGRPAQVTQYTHESWRPWSCISLSNFQKAFKTSYRLLERLLEIFDRS
jgi:hypothetical protein